MPTSPTLAAVLLLACAATQAAERPNIVIAIADDLRWDAVGHQQRTPGGRYAGLATPAIDRLAAEGGRFGNAFVVTSLCSPSRAAMLTGNYGHVNGIVGNRTPLSAAQTYATRLAAEGYDTGYFGKWHMGSQAERPGFAHAATYLGQGQYEACEFLVDGVKTATTSWVDDATAAYADAFIRRRRDRPFLAVVGFKSPHAPFTPPERERTGLAAWTWTQPANALPLAPWLTAAYAVEPDKVHDYLRCVQGMDAAFARVLTALDASGLAGSTLVVFTSDNGFEHGEHGLLDKRAPTEESMRVPLVMRWPGRIRPGSEVAAMTLNIDLMPTVVEAAGARLEAPVAGRSLLPLLAGPAPADWRSGYLYVYQEGPGRAEAASRATVGPGFSVPTCLAWRGPRYKAVHYPGNDSWDGVYDLAADPGEQHNLRSDPSQAGLCAEQFALLAAERQRLAWRSVEQPRQTAP